MSVDPIRVSRAQWDAALERVCRADPGCGTPAACEGHEARCDCRAVVARVLDCERPAPDTPPTLTTDDGQVLGEINDTWGEIAVAATEYPLLLPWVEDHLLPWLRAMTKEDR